jgi:DNA (cytosine-5)-methyltransferase 1
MKFIDLFAGIGGFHYGLQQVEGFECVYANEWDKYANSVYRKHFGECDERDIRTVNASEIFEFDLLVGGFPCQSFSVAGRRGGFADTRGTLFFEIARIIKEKQPHLLLLENVKGLLSHDKGETFRVILSSLDGLGYDLQWQVCNSKNFGVPQNRERVFIIGHLRGTPRPQIFPLGSDNAQNKVIVSGMMTGGKWDRFHESSRRVYDPKGISPTLPTSAGGGHIPKIDGEKIHQLTPIECERIQGFPDNWTKYGSQGEEISDTQRYKMLGNAVTPNVITEIGKRLCGISET